MFNFFHKKDDQIQRDVKSEIAWDPRVESQDISVSSRNGVVTLSGSVPRYFERHNAEAAARRIGGVKTVEDLLEIHPPDSYTRSDEQIQVAANQALDWNYEVPAGIEVLIECGWATITGAVEWAYQRDAAESAIARLTGVVGVDNLITIAPKKADFFSVRDEIEDALKRSAAAEGNKVLVTINDGTVTLSGSLESSADIETARIAAWSGAGVTDVINNLTLLQ